ncbi:MAG TPA: hypothetical protein VKY26_03255 [Actinomycetota bacterium]|nr:hypothetical protein [Actinomycetota bacterium]
MARAATVDEQPSVPLDRPAPAGPPRAGLAALTDPDALILLNIHPAKLAVDAIASATSFWLLWRGRTKLGFAVHYLVPVATSALVLTRDVGKLRATPAGRYVLSIPRGGHAARAAGDTLMVRGARRRQPRVIAAGALLAAAGWSSGLFGRAAGAVAPTDRLTAAP